MGQESWGPAGPPVPVPGTGQTTTYADGDEGDLQVGVILPVPRFTDNGYGTVTDNMTGLVWTKAADCNLSVLWNDALEYCNTLAAGSCGLSDGSSAGDWRLPNIRELLSLIDYGHINPPLPATHPFTNIPQEQWYWSSTTMEGPTYSACSAQSTHGSSHGYPKLTTYYHTWCVRGGQ